MFDGECDGPEIRMANQDTSGTKQEQASRCSEACATKKQPLKGSWSGFVAKGFITNLKNGACFCEAANSESCTRQATDGYARYDWGASDRLSGCIDMHVPCVRILVPTCVCVLAVCQ